MLTVWTPQCPDVDLIPTLGTRFREGHSDIFGPRSLVCPFQAFTSLRVINQMIKTTWMGLVMAIVRMCVKNPQQIKVSISRIKAACSYYNYTAANVQV